VKILGVQDGINSSACLLIDGVIVAALQEERFSGVKEHIGFPYRSVEAILKMNKLTIDQIDEMALATSYYTVSPGVEGHTSSMSLQQWLKDRFPVAFGVYEDNAPVLKERFPNSFGRLGANRNRFRLARIRQGTGFGGTITIVDHHIAHAASGYYSSPLRDDVLVLSLDASGDGLCASVNVGNGGTFHRIARTVHTHSPGYLYTAVTGAMGMKQHSHEYKLMGLAPHASEKSAQGPYEKFKSYIEVDGLEFRRKVPEPLHHIKPRLKEDMFKERFDGIAAGLQRITEELMVQWTRNALRHTGLKSVTAAGGVFMNVKANKLIRELPEVQDFFPMPSSGDETTSIGAAQWVYAQRRLAAGQEVNIKPLDNLYLGDEPTEKDISQFLQNEAFIDGMATNPRRWEVTAHTRNVDDLAADLILKNEIVARVRGQMEFGARALGNRSILCDASDLRNVRNVNQFIKSRDFFMPFAPVIMARVQNRYIVNPRMSAAPFMNMAFDTTPLASDHIIAGLHQADLTARPQILDSDTNPGYRSILSRYYLATGRGGLLNTSYNLHGSPLVHGVEDAFRTFINSGLKYLVIGDYLLSKV
jgi:carbamoyltransferase